MADQMLGHNKWQLDGNGTAVKFGLLLGEPVLQQMVCVGRGLIGKEVAVQMLRGTRVSPDAEVRTSSRDKQRYSWLLWTRFSPFFPNQVTNTLLGRENEREYAFKYVVFFPCSQVYHPSSPCFMLLHPVIHPSPAQGA